MNLFVKLTDSESQCVEFFWLMLLSIDSGVIYDLMLMWYCLEFLFIKGILLDLVFNSLLCCFDRNGYEDEFMLNW